MGQKYGKDFISGNLELMNLKLASMLGDEVFKKVIGLMYDNSKDYWRIKKDGTVVWDGSTTVTDERTGKKTNYANYQKGLAEALGITENEAMDLMLKKDRIKNDKKWNYINGDVLGKAKSANPIVNFLNAAVKVMTDAQSLFNKFYQHVIDDPFVNGNQGTVRQDWSAWFNGGKMDGNPRYAENSCITNAVIMRPAFMHNFSMVKGIMPDLITQLWYESTMESLIKNKKIAYDGSPTMKGVEKEDVLKILTGKKWTIKEGYNVESLYQSLNDHRGELNKKYFYTAVLSVYKSGQHAVNIIDLKKIKDNEYQVTWSDGLAKWDVDGRSGIHTSDWDDFVKKYGGFIKWSSVNF